MVLFVSFRACFSLGRAILFPRLMFFATISALRVFASNGADCLFAGRVPAVLLGLYKCHSGLYKYIEGT